jgi:tetratricopeptide (TPR) repeat protein
VCALFAWRSHERAAIWRSPAAVVADAAHHYPDGVSAHLLRAKRAAQLGDVDVAVEGIRAAMARGYNRYEQLLVDPGFAPVRGAPAFTAVIREIAAGWIEAGQRWRDPTQGELRRLASAHLVRGERDAALALLRRALARGGPLDEAIRADLSALGAAP